MKFNISMPIELHKKLQQKAKELHMSVSEYIRYALVMLWKGE